MRRRLDAELVRRGLAPSRERAKELIENSRVTVAGAPATKATRLVDAGEPVEVEGPPARFVGRGGEKLEGALDRFSIDPGGLVVLDAGSSTGGFTDCLLQRGATKSFAIDVGYGQLHNKLLQDPRVVVMERTNARHLEQGALPEEVDLVVIDASFIGLEKLLPAAHALLKAEGEVLALVEPQFQVGQDKVGKGGVVRDPELRREATAAVAADAEKLGFALIAQADCVITGPKGNQETFIWLRRSPAAHAP